MDDDGLSTEISAKKMEKYIVVGFEDDHIYSSRATAAHRYGVMIQERMLIQ